MTVPSVVLSASTTSSLSTVNLTITGTANVNDVVYVLTSVRAGGATINSVSCTGSTNATIRTPLHFNPAIQAAWATISTQTVNPVFTVTFSSATQTVVGALVIRGAYNPTSPFDAFPGLPISTGNPGSDAQTATFSTYNYDALLIFGAFNNATTGITTPAGWTEWVNVANSPAPRLDIATLNQSTPAVSLAATCTNAGANPFTLADAIVGQPFSVPTTPYVVMTTDGGSTSTASFPLVFNGTVQPNDVIYVVVAVQNGTQFISTVSCTGSTNAAKRPNAISGTAIQAAWATITTQTVNPTFTINFALGVQMSAVGIVIRGVTTPLSPFDANAAIPNQSGTATVSFTTSSTNDLLIFGGFINTNGTFITAPTGWQQQNWCGVGNSTALLATLASSSKVTGLNATEITGGANPWTFADAISTSGVRSAAISGEPLSTEPPNPYTGFVEAATAADTFTIQTADVDNIIDIDGFEKYGPALNSNIATFNASIANIMNIHNNATLMRYQGFLQEWNGSGGSTGSSVGFITGRAGGNSTALCIGDFSGNTTSISKVLPGNYSRTIVGFAMVTSLGSACGIQFNEIAAGNAMMTIWVDNLGKINISRGNMNGGTILFTSSAQFLANAWHYVEIDFSIHPSAGFWSIWVDGVLINTTTGQNTRGFGTNNYWNLLIPLSRSSVIGLDDLYIRDNTNGTAVPFGDSTIDRLPVVANNSVQFTPSSSTLGSRYAIQCVQTNAPGANQLALIPVTPAVAMTINSVGILTGATDTNAKYKGVIYSDNSGAPGSLLSSGTEVVGVFNNETLTLPLVTPQALTGNTQYWIGFITNNSVVLMQSDNFSFVGQKKANTYTSGAPAGPLSGMSTGQPTWVIWGNCTSGSNFDVVNRIPSPVMVGTAMAYNTGSTAGQTDLYQTGTMPIVPNKIYALKVSALAQKSDSGVRTMNLHAKSGSADSTGSNPNIAPGNNMQWYSTILDTDPATAGAWGPTAINSIKIGYEVAS